jgi:hypothetical protein
VGWTTGDGFPSGLETFLFASTVSRQDLGPIQPPVQCIRGGGLSLGINRSEREANHTSLLAPRLRMCGAIPSQPHAS